MMSVSSIDHLREKNVSTNGSAYAYLDAVDLLIPACSGKAWAWNDIGI